MGSHVREGVPKILLRTYLYFMCQVSDRKLKKFKNKLWKKKNKQTPSKTNSNMHKFEINKIRVEKSPSFVKHDIHITPKSYKLELL